jgi:AIPR protein
MLTRDFYNTIDAKLDALIQKYKDDKFLKKHKSAINNQKSYALLIWFLDFYGRKSNYTDFITDGDNDSSCDIVFDNTNNQGEKIFYVVQSKWNNADNSEIDTNRGEILKALNDFETILRGEKQHINPKLKIKLEELDKHLKANGEVKFIFLTLSQYKGGADENINVFRNNDEKTKFEVIDITRIKVDYIDRTYKKIEPVNPLESYHNPEDNPVSLEIVQKNGNYIKIEKPFDAYMLLLRAKSVYDLFEKYGFALFYKNVRNPLLQSRFNEEIEKTAIENPAYFWYYNNGITAITYLLPTIGKKAEKIELTGLQIINGAQTVYAIHRAYKNANFEERKRLDAQLFVNLRLMQSGGKDFDLNVTRFTNSQNPVSDRDFCANDDIQVALQNASYQTKFWYEKRNSEFREVPEGVTKISNLEFSNAYLAYHLQDPTSVLKIYEYMAIANKELNFLSRKQHKDGLYEKIFNKDTQFEDMLAAYYLFNVARWHLGSSHTNTIQKNLYHVLALFKVVFAKYSEAKFGAKINSSIHVIKLYDKGDFNVMLQVFSFTSHFFATYTNLYKNDANITKITAALLQSSYYERMKADLEDTKISVQDIEGLNVSVLLDHFNKQ